MRAGWARGELNRAESQQDPHPRSARRRNRHRQRDRERPARGVGRAPADCDRTAVVPRFLPAAGARPGARPADCERPPRLALRFCPGQLADGRLRRIPFHVSAVGQAVLAAAGGNPGGDPGTGLPEPSAAWLVATAGRVLATVVETAFLVAILY